MIELHNITAGYGMREVLHGVSFTAEAGTITSVLGCNGCGKSTLLKTIIGALPLMGGSITIDGRDISAMKPRDIARKVAYLPQGKQVPDITVGRLVLHGRFPYLRYPRRYRTEDYAIAAQAMEEMGISHLQHQPMATLSGGLRQKAYIAMALAQQAPVIVMDEPTTYLDIAQQMKFARLVQDLAAKGKTILLVLHDIPLALQISHRILLMENGRIRSCTTPHELLQSDDLQQVYGVRIGTAETARGTQYYYEFSANGR